MNRLIKMLKRKKFLYTLIVVLFSLIGKYAHASHVMGGSITYECMGNGNYIFELVFYRDCNGAQVNTNSQNIRVWNHQTLTNISLPYVSTEDISPEGTASNGVNCYNCLVPNGNIGIGSIEKITYRSGLINISGVPPAQGWVFTFDDFSRNGNITNLQNPLNYGVTLTAKIFNVGASNNVCHDSSPKFLQIPHFVSCVGKPYKLNLNPVDPDLDSLHITFDQPLTNLNNNPYVEGVNPTAIPFVAGFSSASPTPSSTMVPGNQNAQINNETGEITFLSNLAGNFNVKIKVSSFRNKKKVSEVVHEMQIIVTNCLGNNNPPIVTPPFSGSYEMDVVAGNAVNFNLMATDFDNLQDGSPQTVTINPTGLLFGPNPTVAANCINGPCPVVGPAAPLTGSQGATMSFNWQTDCNHLLDKNGNELDQVPYQFVFRISDDYCPIPEVLYETVTINVLNPGVIQAPPITCIQGNGTSDFTINWDAVNNPSGTFIRYEVHTVQNGLITTIPAIGTTSFTHTGVTEDLDYFITVVSGCNGLALRNSDTIRNVYLNISNINPGIAVLDWNNPTNAPLPSIGSMYYIHREYPAGVWSVIDSVPYGITHYEEIIDLCDEVLNYQITLNNNPCDFTSQINGATFTDQTPPDIPGMTSVTIDTLTNETQIYWNPSTAPDTYGYIIYMQHPVTGFLIELDTIYGQFNTSYSYLEDYIDGSTTYTVAAFDSCPSPFGAPFNLSARDPNFHSTVFLSNSFSTCAGTINLSWTSYRGWNAASYDVFVKKQGESWQLLTTVTGTSHSFLGENQTAYEIVIRANKGDGTTSFSNMRSFVVATTLQPRFSYISTAAVLPGDQSIEIKYIYDDLAIVTKIELQRLNRGEFETIEEVENPSAEHVFIDENVYVDDKSYMYRVIYYDSCGNKGYVSNSAQTILLKSQLDQTTFISYVNWSPYSQFNGSIIGYNLYRSINGAESYDYVATIPSSQLSFEDNLYDLDNEGQVCYRVEALEGPNIFNNPEVSRSNETCVVIDPLVYIPNAFYPDGVNTIFIPVIRSYVIDSYRLTVFDRWGQVVFQTGNPLEGWNGLINNSGREAETATYVYMVEFNDGNGEQIKTRGHVTLLR